MKFTLNFLLATTLFLLINFTSAFGQRPNREQMIERQTNQMIDKLELSEEQTEKVKAINLAYSKKMEEARKEPNLDREAMKTLRTTIDKEKSAELKLILTADQYKKYEAMVAENQKNRRGRGERGGRGGNGKTNFKRT